MTYTAEHEDIHSEDIRDTIEEILDNADSTTVIDISERSWKDSPPDPLNLVYAQRRIGGIYNTSGSHVLSAIQDLYQDGHVTYPRTDNQKYSDDFAFESICNALDGLIDVPDFKSYTPTEGDSHDPAHPPITPTKNAPYIQNLDDFTKKVYFYIAKHFLATLSAPAEKKVTEYTLDVDGYEFTIDIRTMGSMGYHNVYPYATTYSDTPVNWDIGDELTMDAWKIEEKETNPPNRYSESSIIGIMEDQNLGTSATRANMVDKVIDRGYVHNEEGLETGRLGKNIIQALREYAPQITDSTFTSDLQNDLNMVRKGDKNRQEVIDKTCEWVAGVCEEINENEYEIGREIRYEEDSCPECGEGMWLNKSDYGLYWSCETDWDDCDYTESA